MNIKTKENKKFKVTIISMTLFLSGSLLYGYYNLNNQLDEQNKRIVEITKTTNELEKKLDHDVFSKRVIKSVKDYVLEEQKEMVNLKYEKYSNIPAEGSSEHFIYGSPDARFTLLTFSEVECPYCQRFHETPKQIVNESNGDVNIKWMHFPLPFHNPAAEKEALAAECIAEQKGNRGFWLAIDEMFKATEGNGKGVKSITSIAQLAGADLEKFNACFNESRYTDKIKRQIEIGNKLNVNSTPTTIIIDNKTLNSFTITGAQPSAAIKSVINRMVGEDSKLEAEQ